MTTSSHDDFARTLEGRSVDDATREAARVGWLVRPYSAGTMLTMEFRKDRMNLEHDEQGVVTRAWAG